MYKMWSQICETTRNRNRVLPSNAQMGIKKVQAIAPISVTSYIVWLSSAPELHAFLWPLVRVHEIFWLSRSPPPTSCRNWLCVTSVFTQKVNLVPESSLRPKFQVSYETENAHIAFATKRHVTQVLMMIMKRNLEYWFIKSYCLHLLNTY